MHKCINGRAPEYLAEFSSGGEVHHPTVLRSVNLSQPSGQLHQRRVRDKVSDRVRVRARARVRNRVRDRHRLSVKKLGGELLHQRHRILSSKCPRRPRMRSADGGQLQVPRMQT